MFDIGLRCKYLLPVCPENPHQLLENQFLAIQEHRIVSIKSYEETDRNVCKHFIDAGNQLVMPGLINGHTHLAMNLLRGTAENKTLQEWLQKIIFPVEAQVVDAEFVQIGVELALLESLYAGVTTVCDMYYFQNIAADVVDRVGMRALLGEGIASFPTPNTRENPENAYRIIEALCEKYQGHERISIGYAPHAPYTCDDQTFQTLVKHRERYRLPIVIHVAETSHEVEESLKNYGASPVKRLHNLGLMDQSTIFVHAVHLSEEDISLVANAKTSIIYNPESNMKLGSGIAPIEKFLQANIPVGIGTDGAASNNNLNLIGEMSTGIKLQKLQNPLVKIDAVDMIEMATLQGAKAIGLDRFIGSLEVGKFADVITLDVQQAHWLPEYNLVNHLVHSANGSEVNTVICHGKVLLENRQPTTIHQTDLFAQVEKVFRRVKRFL